MKIADSVKSGDYRFVCLLHPTMVGKLSIVAKSSAIQDQATLDSSGDSLFASDKSNAQQLLASAPSPASTAQAGAVQAGVVGKELAINQFFPAQVSVRAGGTVTWNNTSFEPHTVTFGKALTFSDAVLFGPPIQPAAGVASSTTFAFSGFIGGKPFPASTFSLRFSKAGTYSYTCSIHPGMAGTVVVT
jgi:plastocyanin